MVEYNNSKKLFEQLVSNVPSDIKIFAKKQGEIAVRMASILKNKGTNLKTFAKKIKIKESLLNRILAGNANCTLKTIAKIEVALDDDIIIIPMFNKRGKNSCQKCDLLMELYERIPEADRTKRDYWIFTELFFWLHGDRDYCDGARNMGKSNNRRSKYMGIIRFSISELKKILYLPESLEIADIWKRHNLAGIFEILVEDPNDHFNFPEVKEGNQIPYIEISDICKFKNEEK